MPKQLAAYSCMDPKYECMADQMIAMSDWIQIDGRSPIWFTEHLPIKYHERPEMRRLKALCRLGRIDTVLIYSFDRFALSPSDFMDNMETLCKFGVRMISLVEKFDTEVSMNPFDLVRQIQHIEHVRKVDSITTRTVTGTTLGPLMKQKIRDLHEAGESQRSIQKIIRTSAGKVKKALDGY